MHTTPSPRINVDYVWLPCSEKVKFRIWINIEAGEGVNLKFVVI